MELSQDLDTVTRRISLNKRLFPYLLLLFFLLLLILIPSHLFSSESVLSFSVSEYPPPPLAPPPPPPAVHDDTFPERYRRHLHHEPRKQNEFDPNVQTTKWVKEDLKSFDKYALQKCYGGDDPVERVFGYNIWFQDGVSQNIGDKFCLYDGYEHPEKFCKEVYCEREYHACVMVRGFNTHHNKKMTVVGCSKDETEQCYLHGKGKKTGDTHGMLLGGPIGDIWNSEEHSHELTACQCSDVKEDEREDTTMPCNADCEKYVQTCSGTGHH